MVPVPRLLGHILLPLLKIVVYNKIYGTIYMWLSNKQQAAPYCQLGNLCQSKGHMKQIRSATILVTIIGILLALSALVACAPLTQRAQVTSPVVKYVPPIQQPDGTFTPGHLVTNNVTHPGVVVDPTVLNGITQPARLFGPYGDAIATLIALGAAGYAKFANSRELKKHLDSEHQTPGS